MIHILVRQRILSTTNVGCWNITGDFNRKIMINQSWGASKYLPVDPEEGDRDTSEEKVNGEERSKLDLSTDI